MSDQIDNERCADPSDLASKFEQLALESSVALAGKATGPKPTGYCLDEYCGEPLLPASQLEAIEQGKAAVPDDCQRWCGPECRDNWERERNTRRKQGF